MKKEITKNKVIIGLCILILVCAVIIGIGQFNKYKIKLMNTGAQIGINNLVIQAAQCQQIPFQLNDEDKTTITLVAVECLQTQNE